MPQAHGVSDSHYNNSRSPATERLQCCIHYYLTPTTSKTCGSCRPFTPNICSYTVLVWKRPKLKEEKRIGFFKREEGSKKVNNLPISTVVLYKFALFFPSSMVRIKAAHLPHRKSQDICPIKAYLVLVGGAGGKKALDRLH